MSDKDNPFGGMGGQYSTNVSYGAQPASAGIPQPVAPLQVKDVTTANFAVEVLQESRKQPVLVDFWAPWCGPCKQLQPALERVVAAAKGAVKLVKMNIDEHPAIAGQLGIQSIPAVIAFNNGQPVDGFMGAVPETQISDFIQKLVGKNGGQPQIAEALAAARQAREAGDLQTAADIFDAVLQEQPDNVEAIAGLADLLFEAGDAAGAQEVIDRLPEDKQGVASIAAVKTKMKLAAEAASLGDAEPFQRRLAENPGDHQARFDLAMIENAQGRREEAADSLLYIVRADRTWNDDGARTQLLKFFEAWGMTDDATLSARRKLSSILFS
ncbi:MAG: thioredoxin [Hyphomicrobiales bacterium]|nr:thioredoxin [Hyphomicrobiales bacterium]